MPKHPEKRDFPVSQVRRYLEPGPIVLVSSRWAGQTNIMTLGWHTVLEFTPSLVGCMIAGGNHSFAMIRNSRECEITLHPVQGGDTPAALQGHRSFSATVSNFVLAVTSRALESVREVIRSVRCGA